MQTRKGFNAQYYGSTDDISNAEGRSRDFLPSIRDIEGIAGEITVMPIDGSDI